MEIRSITLFCPPDTPPARLAPFLSDARQAFTAPIQSLRLATPPFPEWLPRDPEGAQAAATALAQDWQAVGMDYISLGPVLLRHDPGWLALIPRLVGATGNLFAAGEMANGAGEIDFGRIHSLAALIQQLSRLYANGFGNLYFAALANCPPGCPYFPAAYHAGGPPHFALAVESADLAVTAVQGATDLAQARAKLQKGIEDSAENLTIPARQLAARHNLTFSGLDFSLSPFPTAARSVGTAFTHLGIDYPGAAGSLFAAAFLTEALQRARFQRCGFNSLMLPVLEDSALAEAAAAGRLSLSDLLSYSAVCGVGLDTVPLPGEVTIPQLSAILADVAALAARLNKPLTARLMPMPGKAAGDPVSFDFPYFAAGRVLPVSGAGLTGLLGAREPLTLHTLPSR